MTPAISILIRTFNSAGTLAAVLERLPLAPGDELIIVDSGSVDATLAIAAKHRAHIVSAPPPFNYSKSLNLGFQAAQNPWVLVLSSHCLPLSDQLLEMFRSACGAFPESVVVAYGECSLVTDRKSGDAAVRYADRMASAAQRRQVYGGNGLALYRRAAWQARPFDEALPTGEDRVWFLQALESGTVAASVPAARVLYRNQGSLRHMFRKGWEESRMEARLAGMPAMTFWQLGIAWGSLLKKWLTGKIPAAVLIRQGAHMLGAYLSPKFSDRLETATGVNQ